MKLLVITQVMDTKHPVLGFFHRWIIELAKHVEQIHVIALQVGEYNLPENVSVVSLGKEEGVSKFVRIKKFYSQVFSLRKEYDHVFVHMNPEYIVLAGFLWKLWEKKVGLWYNHTVGSFALRVSAPFVDMHMHTSPYAYPSRYSDAVKMPAGINTDVFKDLDDVSKKPNSIYFQGRVALAKRVHILLEAFDILRKEGKSVSLTIVGPEEEGYVKPLKEKYKKYVEENTLSFMGPVPHAQTPVFFNEHSVSVNLTDDGNYDKTVLESLACGTPVIVSSKAFKDIVPSKWTLDKIDSSDLSEKIKLVLEEKDVVKESIKEKHSIAVWAEELSKMYEA